MRIRSRRLAAACVVSSLPILSIAPAFAAEEARDTPIIVTAQRSRALEADQQRVDAQPGNVSLVPSEEFDQRFAVTLRDALAFTPGVSVRPNVGEDSRLSIRGSGLAQNFHLRGVELLFNGVPINQADGFGDFQEIDLLFASHLVVSRGANAFHVGSASLGGAIEVQGLTAHSAQERAAVRLEGGSFGTSRLNARLGDDWGRFDGLVAGSWQRQEGFRDHTRQANFRGYGAFNLDWSDNLRTEFGALANEVNQELAGAVSLAQALRDPRAPNPAAVRGDFARDIASRRAFTSTRWDISDTHRLTVGASYAGRSLFHPIAVLIAQNLDDYTGFVRYEGAERVLGVDLAWTAGARLRDSDLASEVSVNVGGQRGPLLGQSRQASASQDAFGEIRIGLAPAWEAVAGLTYVRSVRDFTNLLDRADDDRLVFAETSPRFGLFWQAAPAISVFANASASFEPPIFADLTQGGLPGFVPLQAQDGFTYEIGARGRQGRIAFEAAYYRARLDNELVAFVVDPLLPAPIFNAEETTHEGVELFAALDAVENWRGLSIRPRLSYSFNCFRFRGDPVFGDNQLAGLPDHVGRAEIEFAWKHLRFAPNIQFQTGDAFLDYANTQTVPGFVLFGLEASADLHEGVSFFLEARNLENEAHVSNFSTVADARAATNLNLFTPGEGRAVFAGLRFGFGGRP